MNGHFNRNITHIYENIIKEEAAKFFMAMNVEEAEGIKMLLMLIAAIQNYQRFESDFDVGGNLACN